MQPFILIVLCHFHCYLSWILINGFLLPPLFQICVICKQIHGSCTQCSRCSTYYHAMCASRAGYRMEVRFLLFFVFSLLLCTFDAWGRMLLTKFIYCQFVLVFKVVASLLLVGLFLILVYNIANNCILYMQLHSLEKNGKQITKMVSYCAYHRYG